VKVITLSVRVERSVERSRDAKSRHAPRHAISTLLDGCSGRTVMACLTAMLMLVASPGLADSSMPAAPWANRQLPDPKQESRAAALMETLRCVVCQGQSIADSDAEMAGDMRSMVRERIARGESPEQIREWMISRYGNWISFAPPVEPTTWPLWFAPFLLLLAGVWLARGRLRKGR
jgi:cytochrome c-type biogenesis protein CcmH